MSADIGKGDWVECVSVSSRESRAPGRGYEIGGVYRVTDVHVWHGRHQLNCAGCVRPEELGLPFPGWSAGAFRPIYRPNQSIIEQLKQPIKVREPEAA